MGHTTTAALPETVCICPQQEWTGKAAHERTAILGGGFWRDGIDGDPHISARRCLLGEGFPFVVLDAEMELAAYCALFARSGCFLERVAQTPGDLLVLDRLGLISEYRRGDLGLTIIRETTRELGSACAAVALMPTALNYEHATGQFTCANCVPSEWSPVILAAFIGHFASPFGLSRSWDAKDALRFIEASGGRLTVVRPDDLRYLRKQLVGLERDDFLWLLRWLNREKTCETRTVQPVGETKAFAVDVQIILATNRKLEEKVAARRFREDLYYRVSGLTNSKGNSASVAITRQLAVPPAPSN
jgi:hypothetical protein